MYDKTLTGVGKPLKEWPCMWQNNEDIPDFD